MDELVDQGPEISAAIHALNSLTEEELKEYNQAYLEKSELSRKQAEKDTEKLKKEIEAQTAELNRQAEKEKNRTGKCPKYSSRKSEYSIIQFHDFTGQQRQKYSR